MVSNKTTADQGKIKVWWKKLCWKIWGLFFWYTGYAKATLECSKVSVSAGDALEMLFFFISATN